MVVRKPEYAGHEGEQGESLRGGRGLGFEGLVRIDHGHTCGRETEGYGCARDQDQTFDIYPLLSVRVLLDRIS